MVIMLAVKQFFCRHKFAMEDLKLTHIAPPPTPFKGTYAEWEHFYEGIDTHESHTHRVEWPCDKCGKVFYAHCGLDIAPENGGIFRRDATES